MSLKYSCPDDKPKKKLRNRNNSRLIYEKNSDVENIFTTTGALINGEVSETIAFCN